jgi:hypothetical protein
VSDNLNRQQAARAGDPPPPSGKVDPRVYGRVVRDKRLKHGAVRLWHLLLDHMNKREGRAWPAQRTIVREIGCDPGSLKRWTSQLIAGGYLTVEKVGQNHHLVYRFPHWHGNRLGGKGKQQPRAVAKPNAAHQGKPTGAMVKNPTPRDGENQGRTNLTELNPRTEGEAGEANQPRCDPRMKALTEDMRKALANPTESAATSTHTHGGQNEPAARHQPAGTETATPN